MTLIGTPGPDFLTGTPGIDVIAAGGGDDIVRGLAGQDVICGGAGRDRLEGGPANDRIFGGPGADVIVAGPSLGPGGCTRFAKCEDFVFGNGGNDRILGGAGPDELRGGSGSDVMIGGRGNDTFEGRGRGLGNDRIRGGRGGDETRLHPGNDSIRGGPGIDTIFARLGGIAIGPVMFNLPAGIASGTIVRSRLHLVENVEVDWPDTVTVVGTDDRNFISVFGSLGSLVRGRGGPDVIHTFAPDHVFGGRGRDYIQGFIGPDSLNGGPRQTS